MCSLSRLAEDYSPIKFESWNLRRQLWEDGFQLLELDRLNHHIVMVHLLNPNWQDNVEFNDFTSIMIIVVTTLRVLKWLVVNLLAQDQLTGIEETNWRESHQGPVEDSHWNCCCWGVWYAGTEIDLVSTWATKPYSYEVWDVRSSLKYVRNSQNMRIQIRWHFVATSFSTLSMNSLISCIVHLTCIADSMTR